MKDSSLLILKGENRSLFSYSIATSDQWPEHITDLRKRGIKRVFLCGLAYAHCVGESARDLPEGILPAVLNFSVYHGID